MGLRKIWKRWVAGNLRLRAPAPGSGDVRLTRERPGREASREEDGLVLCGGLNCEMTEPNTDNVLQ